MEADAIDPRKCAYCGADPEKQLMSDFFTEDGLTYCSGECRDKRSCLLNPTPQWSDLRRGWWARRLGLWAVVLAEVYIVLGFIVRVGTLLEDFGLDIFEGARPLFIPTGSPLLGEIVAWGLMIPGIEWVRRGAASAFERFKASAREGPSFPSVSDIQGVVRIAKWSPNACSLAFPDVVVYAESKELLEAWTETNGDKWRVLTRWPPRGVVLTRCPAAWQGVSISSTLDAGVAEPAEG